MKIQQTFYPDVDKGDLEYGTMNEISWQRLHQYLEQAVALKPNERLVGITVSEYGVKAKIEFTDGTVNPREIPKH